MKDLYLRTKRLANYIICNDATVRQTAKHFGMAKSTVHYDVSYRLPSIDYALSLLVKEVFEKNFEEKNIRGGNATKKHYELLKKSKNQEK